MILYVFTWWDDEMLIYEPSIPFLHHCFVRNSTYLSFFFQMLMQQKHPLSNSLPIYRILQNLGSNANDPSKTSSTVSNMALMINAKNAQVKMS